MSYQLVSGACEIEMATLKDWLSFGLRFQRTDLRSSG